VSEPFALEGVRAAIAARKPTLFATFALVFGATASFTLLRAPVYRATSLLLIEPRPPNVANVQGVYDPNPAGGPVLDFYRTQFELLKSRRIVEPVARALEVGSRAPFAGAKDPVEAFTSSITIDPVRESRLVRVSVESGDPAFAAAAANALVNELVTDNGRRALGVSGSGLAQLRTLEAALRPKHEAVARALQRFKEENDIFSLDESQSSAAQRLKFLSDELTRVRSERARVVAERRQLEQKLASAAPGSSPARGSSRVLEDLLLSEATVSQEKERLRKSYGPRHPQLLTLDARLHGIHADLERERTRLLDVLRSEDALIPEHQKELELAIDQTKVTLADLGRRAIRLQALRGEAETAETSLRQVAHRIEEVELAMATGSKAENLQVIDEARAPTDPVRPKKAVDLALGAALGLTLGALACLSRGAPHPIPLRSGAVPSWPEPSSEDDVFVVIEGDDELVATELSPQS
jgi:succinoglycan biosynthesis transport protein ExoP